MGTNQKRITTKTTTWSPELDVALPIDGSDIVGFERWVNWNGFSDKHTGFDFAVYADKNNRCVLGLPSETPVRAIGAGVVTRVGSDYGEYASYITIEHGKKRCLVDDGLISGYYHVIPLINLWETVRRGDVIANLYKDPGCGKGRLVHLHLSLWNRYGIRPRLQDPSYVFPQLNQLTAVPQGEKQFRIPECVDKLEISISHFKELTIG